MQFAASSVNKAGAASLKLQDVELELPCIIYRILLYCTLIVVFYYFRAGLEYNQSTLSKTLPLRSVIYGAPEGTWRRKKKTFQVLTW